MSSSKRIVFAPDSFKGTATAVEAAAALARGWARVRPDDEGVQLPMADGGEGTLDAFATAVPGAMRRPIRVLGPANQLVAAEWVELPDGSAVVELASTSGITLLHEQRPLDAHTLGFGQAIAAALDGGATRLLLALGGSSSTDGGLGALTALGAVALAASGETIRLGGHGLTELASLNLSKLRPLPSGGAVVLSDVNNQLLGERGAAAVFAPQKGASPLEVDRLERALQRLVELAPDGVALSERPGAGAAGGTGFGLLLWGAELRSGAASVADAIGLTAALRLADLVITGEGTFDGQSAAGKVPSEVIVRANRAGAPLALVAGSIAASTESFAEAVSLSELASTAAAAMAEPIRWLEAAGAELAARFTD